MKDRERKLKKLKEKTESKVQAVERQHEKRAQSYIAPQEPSSSNNKPSSSTNNSVDIAKLKMKVKKFKTKK